MGRHWYTAGEYARVVERLAATCAVFGLGADVIAGFPGETDEDHAQSVALVERLPFTYLHVFPFSPRPGTAAERLRGRVQASVIADRARQLRELANRKAAAYQQARAGGLADVIVVRGGPAATQREGLTEDYLSVLPSAPLPRGLRYQAKLALDGSRLLALPLAPST
jgi:threonylcarbamoyladenosine tRNA methylthiotransferase MtaB